MRGGGLANRRAKIRHNQHLDVMWPDLLKDVSRLLRTKVINQRGVETHDEPFARWHARRFLDLLRPYGHLIVRLKRTDEVNPFRQNLPRDPPEKAEHADIARI